MDDLIINDEYAKNLTRYINRFTFPSYGDSSIEKRIQDYIGALNQVRQSAILSGETADKLDILISYAEKLKGVCGNIGKDVDASSSHYLREIDDADQFLY